MNRLFKILLVVVVVFTAVRCEKTIHTFPTEPAVDPTLIAVELTLNFDFGMINDPILASYSSALEGSFDIRYTIDIYKKVTGEFVKRIVFTDDQLLSGVNSVSALVELHAVEYEALVWVDFVSKGASSDLYYNTNNNRNDARPLEQIEAFVNPYRGCIETKDAFAAMASIDLRPYRNQYFTSVTIPVGLIRPFAKFKIVTTDIEKYIETYKPASYSDIRPMKVRVSYTTDVQTHFRCGYNVKTGYANYFRENVIFDGDVTEHTQTTAALAFDYVFLTENNTPLYLFMEIYDESGRMINNALVKSIPLERNRLTIVKGEFLTKDVDQGGIGVDDDFDDVINIPIGD